MIGVSPGELDLPIGLLFCITLGRAPERSEFRVGGGLPRFPRAQGLVSKTQIIGIFPRAGASPAFEARPVFKVGQGLGHRDRHRRLRAHFGGQFLVPF